MEWLKLTGPAFRKYVATGKAVAVLPCGSIEKHGEHLPLGTDTLDVETCCREACERTGAIMLPVMPYLFVNEMKASAGAVSLSASTILTFLLEVTDEVARNGIKKILLVNGHGGNNSVLMTFLQDMPGKGRGYAIYYMFVSKAAAREKMERIRAMSKAAFEGGHADDGETDLFYYQHGDLVDIGSISEDERSGASQQDFDIGPALAQTWWYAKHPNSLSGDPRFPSKERGKLIAEAIIEGLAETIVKIRDDEKVAQRNASFEAEALDPGRMW